MRVVQNDNFPVSTTENRTRRARLRAWQVLEILALFAVFYVADRLDVFPFELSQAEPNPLWIPVLLAASLHGRLVGMVAVAVASFVEFSWGWSDFAEHQDLYAFVGASVREPLLWLVAVAILGRFREQTAERLQHVEEERQRKAIEARALADRCDDLGAEVAALEHRIATSGASAAGMALRTFEQLLAVPRDRLPEALSLALARLIGAEGVACYSLNGDRWLLASAGLHGDQPEHIHPHDLAICRAVLESDRILSAARASDRELLFGRAVMAAPTRSAAGEVIGVVLVRHADPACLTLAGEAAVSLGSFIVGQAAQVPGLPAPGGLRQPGQLLIASGGKPRLQIVDNEPDRA